MILGLCISMVCLLILHGQDTVLRRNGLPIHIAVGPFGPFPLSKTLVVRLFIEQEPRDQDNKAQQYYENHSPDPKPVPVRIVALRFGT